MSKQPVVSLIIPIYNSGLFLEQALTSAVSQTLENIEIICVDDASTDNSQSIISKFAKGDNRITTIRNTKNLSAFMTRKLGVAIAKGETVMFLDGDDWLEAEACESAYQRYKETGVEILHFNTNIHTSIDRESQRYKTLVKLLTPYRGFLYGDQVFDECFDKGLYGFNLCNKLFGAKLIKAVYAGFNDDKIHMAEDALVYFAIALKAISYGGAPELYLYNYRFAIGLSSGGQQTFDQFNRVLSAKIAYECMSNMINGSDIVTAAKRRALAAMERRLMSNCIDSCFNKLSAQDAPLAFDKLVATWPTVRIVAQMSAMIQGAEIARAADKLKTAQMLQSRASTYNPKTIGLFYHRYHSGGVQRVLQGQIKILVDKGYKVILMTEEIRPGIDFDLPLCVERIILPMPSKEVDCFAQRGEAITNVIEHYKIDCVIYHAASNPQLLFDFLFFKSAGLPFILVKHETAFANMVFLAEIASKVATAKLADKLIVLSRTEEQYWQLMGANAHYIPNPISVLSNSETQVEKEQNSLLWTGRLDEQKQYFDLITVIEQVATVIPEVKLYMICIPWSTNTVQKMKDAVYARGLEGNIIVLSPQSSLEHFYQKASIYLLTSAWESFPCVIGESKSFGLPLVLYDLPYLELLQNEKGYMSVQQGDACAMAEAVIELLSNEGLRKRMGEEARNSLQEFQDFDYATAWEEVILSPYSGRLELNDIQIDNCRLKWLMDEMVQLYTKGLNRKV
jgi:glycosyltransferase involved in cell wall biosynthesis